MADAPEFEVERLRKELDEWKAAAGWRADGFGPQTPAEVAVFQRQADYVNGQVTGLEIAKLRRERDRLVRELEGAEPILKACEACFNETKGMVRYSTEESDCFWELAELLMKLTAQRRIATPPAEAEPAARISGV